MALKKNLGLPKFSVILAYEQEPQNYVEIANFLQHKSCGFSAEANIKLNTLCRRLHNASIIRVPMTIGKYEIDSKPDELYDSERKVSMRKTITNVASVNSPILYNLREF